MAMHISDTHPTMAGVVSAESLGMGFMTVDGERMMCVSMKARVGEGKVDVTYAFPPEEAEDLIAGLRMLQDNFGESEASILAAAQELTRNQGD